MDDDIDSDEVPDPSNDHNKPAPVNDNAKDTNQDSNHEKDLQVPTYDENIIEQMSMLLDRDIALLTKEEIMV